DLTFSKSCLVRKQHNAGYKHKANVRTYYQQFEEQQTQSLIDQRIKEHLGQAAAFQQVGAAFNQHLMAQRPRLPVLPTPVMPIPGAAPLPMNQPMVPGIRPPVLPRPLPGPPGGLCSCSRHATNGGTTRCSFLAWSNKWCSTASYIGSPDNSSWNCNDTNFF
ncbi:C2H2 and C2HC zinc fingers superfamily protein isoform 5, partial [Theobroma cacao]